MGGKRARPRTASWFIYPPPIWFGDLKSGSEVVGWFWLVGWLSGWAGLVTPTPSRHVCHPDGEMEMKKREREPRLDWVWDRPGRPHIWNADVIIAGSFFILIACLTDFPSGNMWICFILGMGTTQMIPCSKSCKYIWTLFYYYIHYYFLNPVFPFS